jgi:hypothetical protein
LHFAELIADIMYRVLISVAGISAAAVAAPWEQYGQYRRLIENQVSMSITSDLKKAGNIICNSPDIYYNSTKVETVKRSITLILS